MTEVEKINIAIEAFEKLDKTIKDYFKKPLSAIDQKLVDIIKEALEKINEKEKQNKSPEQEATAKEGSAE